MSRGTPHRNVRVPDELWGRALARAQVEGTSVSAVLVQALRKWVEDGERRDTPHQRVVEWIEYPICGFCGTEAADDLCSPGARLAPFADAPDTPDETIDATRVTVVGSAT